MDADACMWFSLDSSDCQIFFFPDCAMNVHHKCQTKVANLCGINQKLLAEALTQVGPVSVHVCLHSYIIFIRIQIMFSAFLIASNSICNVCGFSSNDFVKQFPCTEKRTDTSGRIRPSVVLQCY